MKNQPDASLQIRLASIAIIGLFIALGAVAYFSGQQVKSDSDSVAQDAVPGTIAAHQMRMDMSRSIGWVMVAASALSPESRDASLKTVHDADVAFANHVVEYQATIKINPAKDQALLAEVTSQYAKFQQKRMTYEALILAGDRDKSAAFLENDLVPVYVSAINSAAELLDYNHANSITYAEHISHSVHQLYWALAVVMVLALICAMVLIVNLSIRRRELSELRESEELFHASFDNATVGVCLVSTDGKFLNVNPTMCAMLGYSENELLQLTFNDVTLDEDKEIGQKFLKDAQSGGPKTIQTEKRYLRKDGQVVWAYLSTALVEKSRGDGSYMISHIQDLTERKRAEAAVRESEQKFRSIVEQSPLGIYQSSLDGRLISVNSALATMFGYDTPEQMLNDEKFIANQRYAWPEQRQEIVREASESSASIKREIEYCRRNGTVFPADIYMRVVRSADGTIKMLEGFVEDISLRKRATEQLEMLKVSIDKHFDGAYWLDANNRLVYVNETSCKTLGYTRKEMLGQLITLIAPQATPQLLQEVWKGLRETGFFTRESVHRRKDGSQFPVEIVSTYVRFEGKEFNCGFARDITERKRAESALVEVQRHQERILSALGEGLQVFDRNGIIIYENPAAAAMLGWDAHEMIGRSGHELIHHTRADGSPYPQAECKIFATRLDGVARRVNDEVFWRKDGTCFPVAYICTAMRDEAGEIKEAVVSFRDITERKRAEAELISKTALLEAQVDSTIDGILVVDEHAKKILQNRRLIEIFKIPDEIARDDDDAKLLQYVTQRTKNPKQFSERVAYLYDHPDETGRDEIELQDGIILDRYSAPVLDKAGKHYGRIWTFRDITAQRKVEEQFRQAQKMEAIGTMAGGIAHDFNNILGAIIGYTEMAKRRMANDPTVTRYLDAVYQAGTRAISLVRQILTFSRPDEAQERKPVELGAIVAEPLKLLRATIPSTIEFEVSLPADLPAVLADSTQIHQIVMNLCTNAAHAMMDRPGRLGVRLEHFTVDAMLAGANPGLHPGPYVRLSISDTGHGMSEATKARIFEPFFTTKAPGEGTGLGLAVVHGIMQSHGGTITVYSQQGEGTVFHLYFPVTAGEGQAAAAVATAAPTGHGERILFVDDEKPLALLGQNMLEELDYRVESTTNVNEALEMVLARPMDFDLVITDLTMPKMTGTDFAQSLLEIRPNLPIILTTGYSANLTNERVRAMGIRELLLKPLTVQLLGEAVHRALSQPPPQP